jgi:hypothetical protein
MISASLFFGLFTQTLIGQALIRSAGKLRASSVDLRDKFVQFAVLGEKVWNTFSHRCNITGKTFADRAKNTEGYITIPALHTSKIAPV